MALPTMTPSRTCTPRPPAPGSLHRAHEEGTSVSSRRAPTTSRAVSASAAALRSRRRSPRSTRSLEPRPRSNQRSVDEPGAARNTGATPRRSQRSIQSPPRSTGRSGTITRTSAPMRPRGTRPRRTEHRVCSSHRHDRIARSASWMSPHVGRRVPPSSARRDASWMTPRPSPVGNGMPTSTASAPAASIPRSEGRIDARQPPVTYGTNARPPVATDAESGLELSHSPPRLRPRAPGPRCRGLVPRPERLTAPGALGERRPSPADRVARARARQDPFERAAQEPLQRVSVRREAYRRRVLQEAVLRPTPG